MLERMNPLPAVSPSRRSPRAALALLLAVAAVSPAWAGDAAPAAPVKTQVNDASARDQLLGEHLLTLQWITYDKSQSGKAQVTEENGLLKLKGAQRDGKGNYVTVEGVIETVDAKSFVLVGKVETRVDHIAGGNACPREGRFTFRITGKRRYWRMKEMVNPCDAATDYVDVFLR